MLIISVALAVIRTFFFDVSPSVLAKDDGKVVRIEGVVTEVKVKEYYTAFTVKAGREKVLVKVGNPDTENPFAAYDFVGRKVTVSGAVSLPDGRRNPGCFDYRRYLKGKGIFTILTTNKYKIKAFEVIYPVRHAVSTCKASFYEKTKDHLDEHSFGMTAGILFGETSYMDDDFYTAFQSSGIAHILAVSGLHVNMTYDLVRKLFGKKGSRSIDILSSVLILLYVCLSNFSLSSIRASAMIILKIIAFAAYRRYDSLSAITLIAASMILIDPYLIFDSGMQLSFTAAYTMAAVYPWLKQKISLLADSLKSDLIYKAGNALAPGLAAFAGTAPLCAFHFNFFTPVSLLLNPLAIASAGVIVPAGLAGFVLSSLLPTALAEYAAYIDASILKLFCGLLEKINFLGSALASDASAVSPPPGLLILYYILLFLICSETRYILHRKKLYRRLAIIETFLLALGIVLPFGLKMQNSIFPWDYGTAKITFLDVGQGDSVHIHYGGKDILIDGGGSMFTNVGENTLKPYLLKNGIKKIDMAIVTHEDTDHCKGIYELNEIFEIEKIITNKDVYGNLQKDENDSCIVASLEIEGCRFLFMSDADICRENYLLQAYPELKCDVLKIAHHGSAGSTGEEFVKSTDPSFAVISVGAGNNYGHPSPRVIELLDSCGIIYGRTDSCGAISLYRSGRQEFCFINAAKDKVWHIQRTPQQNTPQGP